jgi:hypothetical protein
LMFNIKWVYFNKIQTIRHVGICDTRMNLWVED